MKDPVIMKKVFETVTSNIASVNFPVMSECLKLNVVRTAWILN